MAEGRVLNRERACDGSLAGMRDLSIELADRPGALAEMGEALGRAHVSVEGGGAWVVDGRGAAHFLFADGAAARRALEAAGDDAHACFWRPCTGAGAAGLTLFVITTILMSAHRPHGHTSLESPA